MEAKESTLPILIVGAGPTGLVLALWLQKNKIPFRIIDKSSGPGETSRAIAVQARTLEFYQQLGIAQELIGLGTIAYEIKMRRFGKIVETAVFGDIGKGISPFSYLLFAPQDLHEKMLIRHLEKGGTIVERNVEFVDFVQDETGVTSQIRSPRGTELVKTKYLCGSDGAHSLVRRQISEFPGAPYDQKFFVADVQALGEMAEGGVQISFSWNDFCIVMPIPLAQSIRLTGIIPAQISNKENLAFEDVAESVTKNTGLKINKVNWFSIYRIHHRVAEHFRQNRVFILGDAGHIHSPAGGQGMNTGIGDAINLAWKLSEVLSGRSPESLLDTYEQERLPFAHQLIRTTDFAFRFIASRSWIGSLFRTELLPMFFARAIRVPAIARLFFKTVSQIRICYPASSLSQGRVADIRGGDRLPWAQLVAGDNYEFLRTLQWQVHVYGAANPSLHATCRQLGYEIYEIPWQESFANKGFQQDAMYVVRPDGYIGLAWETQNTQILKDYRLGNPA